MFTKSLAAAALAGVVAFGGLAATTATASAGYWGNNGNYGNYNGYPPPAYPGNPPPYPGVGRGYGNNWYFNNRPPRLYIQPQPAVQRVCKPIYKTVQVWKPNYGWVWATVYGGQQCWFQQVYPRQNYSYGW